MKSSKQQDGVKLDSLTKDMVSAAHPKALQEAT